MDGPATATGSEKPAAKRLTCDLCRQRKIKCDRAYPKCGRCSQLGHRCSYRGRFVNRNSQNTLITELQERMDQAEAQIALTTYGSVRPQSEENQAKRPRTASRTSDAICQSKPTSTADNDSVPSLTHSKGLYESPNECDMDDMGCLNTVEEIPPFNIDQWASNVDITSFLNLTTPEANVTHPYDLIPEPPKPAEWKADQLGPGAANLSELDETGPLVSLFLLEHAPFFPIFYRERIEREMQQTKSVSMQSLMYTMALSALSASPSNARLEQRYYDLARKFIDTTEANIDCMTTTASINTLQALLLLIRYELNNGHCARAFLTLGRAVRWATLIRLHTIESYDYPEGRRSPSFLMPHMSLSMSGDQAEREEARRCFWALYVFEAYSIVLSDGAIEGKEESSMSVTLPSPGNLESGFVPLPMPTLSEAILSIDAKTLSSFTATVLTASLLRRISHGVGASRPEVVDERPDSGFWDRYHQLLKVADDTSTLLEPFWSVQAPRHDWQDAVAFNLRLILKAVDIRLHQAGVAERERRGLAASHSAASRQRLRDQASWMALAARFKWFGQDPVINIVTPSCTFVRWSLNTAANVYAEENMQCTADETTALNILQCALKVAQKGVQITPDYELDHGLVL